MDNLIQKSEKPSVWLDLEETLINNWQDGLVIYSATKVRNWLCDHKVHTVNIWSHAIWDEKDKEEFVSSGMKNHLEMTIECLIDEYPSVEDMQKLVYHYEHTKYESRSEFMQLNGKMWSFIKFAFGQKVHKHLVLIDDAVPNMTIINDDLGMKIELINVTSLG